MAEIKTLFVTKLYRAAVEGADYARCWRSCRAIAARMKRGRRWSRENGYRGYTSYASLNDLPKRDPSLAR